MRTPANTTVFLGDTHKAMLRAITGLTPGAPASLYRGIAWVIERMYVATVPRVSRENLGLVMEYEHPSVRLLRRGEARINRPVCKEIESL